jgi:hypothetical protein
VGSAEHDGTLAPLPAALDSRNFIFRDGNKQALAFVYCEDEPGRRTTGKLLTRDEARRIAANIAKLPELLTAEPRPDANALVQRR